jgi:hypothetical protein
MKSQVVSLRLPKSLNADLERSSARAELSKGSGLELLLRHAVTTRELLLKLNDSPDLWDTKLDARISIPTFLQLKSDCEQLGIPVSVYIRKVLYHFYVTKRLHFMESKGRYTLAYRHE